MPNKTAKLRKGKRIKKNHELKVNGRTRKQIQRKRKKKEAKKWEQEHK